MKLPTGRQILWGLLIFFIAYAVLTSPSDSADVTGNAWDAVKDGFSALTTFFDELLQG